MERISAWTDLCGPTGEFRSGTQVGGVAPTPLRAGWLNMLQEELASIVEAAEIPLDPEDRSQVLQAIRQFIQTAGGAFVPKTGGTMTGRLVAQAGVRVPKGLPNAADSSVQGYSFGIDGDTGLYAVSGSETSGSDLVLLIDGVELLRLKKSNGSVVLAGNLVLNGDKTTFNTGNKPDLLALMYPVGSVYMNMSSNQNPAVLFGFGTWVALAPGRVLLGAGSGTDSRGDTRVFTAGSTGGEYGHQLAVSEIPAHSHTTPQGTEVPVSGGPYAYSSGDDVTTGTMSNPPPSGEAGGGNPHNNMQPWLVAYMWQRTG
ncbi:phage baseplate protein [Pseudomonas putida]|uniref:phage baseplate protein n=1 Tax=Pseudomonas putida TaxID=303 RepID=UPI004046B832